MALRKPQITPKNNNYSLFTALIQFDIISSERIRTAALIWGIGRLRKQGRLSDKIAHLTKALRAPAAPFPLPVQPSASLSRTTDTPALRAFLYPLVARRHAFGILSPSTTRYLWPFIGTRPPPSSGEGEPNPTARIAY